NPNSIGNNQDQAKVARYESYIRFAYQQADRAVARITDAAGSSANVFVVSDHGFAPFHTAVNMTNLLKSAGVDTSKIAIRTSGPAANIYINLAGREAGGTVDPTTYNNLVTQISNALKNAKDTNSLYNPQGALAFPVVESRPTTCPQGVGLCTSP